MPLWALKGLGAWQSPQHYPLPAQGEWMLRNGQPVACFAAFALSEAGHGALCSSPGHLHADPHAQTPPGSWRESGAQSGRLPFSSAPLLDSGRAWVRGQPAFPPATGNLQSVAPTATFGWGEKPQAHFCSGVSLLPRHAGGRGGGLPRPLLFLLGSASFGLFRIQIFLLQHV